MLPLVSLITVNYNSLPDTLEFLHSTRGLTYPNTEVIVVDNASKEDPTATIKGQFPEMTCIRSNRNLGFAGGNNLGIQAAHGEYLFFLNNDTILKPDFLEEIISFMLSHPDAGMASPKVLFADGVTIQYAGAIGINSFGRGKRIGLMEIDNGQYDKNYKTDLGHGAALIVPRKVVEEIGPMPEVYFLYYEEHDWCEMAKRKGYSMYYIGTQSIIHKESVSTGGNDSYTKVHYLNRNQLLFLRRNFTGVSFVSGFLYYFLVSTPKKIVGYIFRGKFNLAGAIVDGIRWHLRNAHI